MKIIRKATGYKNKFNIINYDKYGNIVSAFIDTLESSDKAYIEDNGLEGVYEK